MVSYPKINVNSLLISKSEALLRSISRGTPSESRRLETQYVLFSIFYCLNYTLPYLTGVGAIEGYHDFRIYLHFFASLLCGLLLLKEKWPNRLLPYFAYFWHLTILYCLPFISTLMFLLAQDKVVWIMHIAVTTMFLLVLVDWRRFFLLIFWGITLGLLFYRIAIGPINLTADYTTSYLLIYEGIFALLMGILFVRRKEQRTKQEHNRLKARSEDHQTDLLQVSAEKQAVLRAIEYTQAEELLTITSDLQKLSLEGPLGERMQTIQTKLTPLAFKLQGIDTRATDYLRLHIGEFSLEQCWQEVKETLRYRGITRPIYFRQLTQHATLVGDSVRITKLLTKAILLIETSSKQHSKAEQPPIIVVLEDTQLSYPMYNLLGDYIKHIPALRIVITTAEDLPPLYPGYTACLAATAIITPTTIPELETLDNARIVRAHYGYTESTPDVLLYVLPIDVRAVRPKGMDKAYMELDARPIRANDQFKNELVDAQLQEQTFLAELATHSQVDLGQVKKAIELIKWYHSLTKNHSQDPFYLHPLAVAQIALDYTTDEATILGALLHDLVKDTPMLLQHLEKVFGKEVAEIVDVVTQLKSIGGSIYKVKLSKEEKLALLRRTNNTRALYIKLADSMHNMRTIRGNKPVDKQKQIATEALYFFVPLAERLGLQQAAEELKERCAAVFKKI